MFNRRKQADQAAPVNPFDYTVAATLADDVWYMQPGGGFASVRDDAKETERIRRLEEHAQTEAETREARAVVDAERYRPHEIDAANLRP